MKMFLPLSHYKRKGADEWEMGSDFIRTAIYHVSVQSYWPLCHRNYESIKVDQEFSWWRRTNFRKCDENKPKSSYLRSSGLLRGVLSFFYRRFGTAYPSHRTAQFSHVLRVRNSIKRVITRKFFFLSCNSPPSGTGPPHYPGFMITLRHTPLARAPLGEWSARRRDLYLTTHNTHKSQTFTAPKGFEHKIPANKRPQTNALDRAATWIASQKEVN